MQLLTAIAFAFQAAAASIPAAAPAASAELRGAELMTALQAGGYTILLRHARTDWSVQEPMGTTPVERSAQRNLSAEGIHDAKLMGFVLKKYQVPIGEIVASPMYRARETAELAAGVATVTMALRVYPSTDEQAALVARAPRAGTNRLLVTHHFVLEKHVPGIRPGDIAESEAAVVKPTGDGSVALVGRIKLADWMELAGVPPQAAATTPTPTPAYAHRVPPPAAADAASAPPSPVTIPDTRPGNLARSYLEAFNSGDAERMRRFIESSLVPIADRPTQARLQTYARSLADYGTFTVTSVRASSPKEIVVGVRTAGGADHVLTVTVSPDHPDRASSITIGTIGRHHP